MSFFNFIQWVFSWLQLYKYKYKENWGVNLTSWKEQVRLNNNLFCLEAKTLTLWFWDILEIHQRPECRLIAACQKGPAIRRQKNIWEKQWTHAAAVWLIQVDSLWCVSIKAFTEARHRGLPKAHQRLAYFISQVENVLRKRGEGQ